MSLEFLLGGLGVVGVLAYALLGGADFGGGVWDALAGGPRKAEQRRAISVAMGPVWEANHVWLIFVIVIMFTAFPPAYAALSEALFVPFHLVLLGIILRGAAFVFRAHSAQSARGLGGAEGLRWGAVFGVASVITPVLLGMCLAAVSVGGVHVSGDRVTIDGTPPRLTAVAVGMGLLALAICAELAAVYLTNETEGKLREDFRGRALLATATVIVLSVLMLPLLAVQAPHLLAALLSMRAVPVLAVGAACALVAGLALLRGRYRLARLATVGQAGCLVGGWAVAQYPFIIYPDVTIANAAAPATTLRFVLYTLPLGLAVLLPSLWYLFRVFKGESLSMTD